VEAVTLILRTKKQREIADIILRAADQGTFLNVTEIYEMLSWNNAYGSLRKTIKSFEDRNLVVKERAGMCVLIKPTQALYDWFRN
jgi:hypothetical protein